MSEYSNSDYINNSSLPKYEYIMRCFDGLTSQGICEELNKLGNDGWKLISCPTNMSCNGINTKLDMFIFVREYYEISMIID